MYLTYDEYEEYGGTLDETAYNQVGWEAQSYIDWLTFNRLQKDTTIPEQVKRCMFELISLIHSQRSILLANMGTDEAQIAKMDNDGVSITYNVMSADKLFDTILLDVNKVIKRRLCGVSNQAGKLLTYRGLYEDE